MVATGTWLAFVGRKSGIVVNGVDNVAGSVVVVNAVDSESLDVSIAVVVNVGKGDIVDNVGIARITA